MFENQYNYPVIQICNPLDESFGATNEDIEAYNVAYHEATEMLTELTGVPCDEEHKYGLVVKFVFYKYKANSIHIVCDGFGELMSVIRELDAATSHGVRMRCFRNVFINMKKILQIETAVYLLNDEDGKDQMLKTFFNGAFGDTDNASKNNPGLSFEMDRLMSVANMWWKKTNARPYTPEELERIEARKKATEEARNAARAQRILSSKCNPNNCGFGMSMVNETDGRKAEISPVATSSANTIPGAMCVEDTDDDEED